MKWTVQYCQWRQSSSLAWLHVSVSFGEGIRFSTERWRYTWIFIIISVTDEVLEAKTINLTLQHPGIQSKVLFS